jgi:AAA15 family ATPase/GTPase
MNRRTGGNLRMKGDFVRILSIHINGIKSIANGQIDFENINTVKKERDVEQGNIIGIYGQNGTGKSAVIEASRILQQIFLGESLPKDMTGLMRYEDNTSGLAIQFFISRDKEKYIVEYQIEIQKKDEGVQIVFEKLICRKWQESLEKWSSPATLFELDCLKEKMLPTKLCRAIKKDNVIRILSYSKLAKCASAIFNKEAFQLLRSEAIKNPIFPLEDLALIIAELHNFSAFHWMIYSEEVIGTGGWPLIFVGLYKEKDGRKPFKGKLPVFTTKDFEKEITISVEDYQQVKEVINQIDYVLNALVPQIHLVSAHEEKQSGKNSLEVKFRLETVRDGHHLSLKYESEGICRMISFISAFTACFNNKNICLMIDEFDSGIFEFLLGEIVEVFEKNGDGQFIFTAHNLRVLEVLSYHHIYLSTTNPGNRFIKMKGIRQNNNVRDTYLKTIALGGAEEEVYQPTSAYGLNTALRKAGIINES